MRSRETVTRERGVHPHRTAGRCACHRNPGGAPFPGGPKVHRCFAAVKVHFQPAATDAINPPVLTGSREPAPILDQLDGQCGVLRGRDVHGFEPRHFGRLRCPTGWNAGARTASNQATYWYNCHSTPFAETEASSPTGTTPIITAHPPFFFLNISIKRLYFPAGGSTCGRGNWTSPPGDTHSNGRPVAYLDGPPMVFNTAPAYYQNGAPPQADLAVY